MRSKPKDEVAVNLAEQLRIVREKETEVDRICRETQDAIITRAMHRLLRPMGGEDGPQR